MKKHETVRKFFAFKSDCSGLLIFLLMLSIGISGIAADLEKELNQAIINGNAEEFTQIFKRGGNQLCETIKNNAAYYIEQSSRYGTAAIVKRIFACCKLSEEKLALNNSLVNSADNDNFADVIPLLLKYGANPNHEYQVNYTLNRVVMIHGANPSRSEKVLATVRKLLDSGAYIDNFDESGETPLMIACRKENLPLVKLLISHSANPTLTNKDMQSAMSCAKPGSDIAAALTQKADTRLETALSSGQSLFSSPDQTQVMTEKEKTAFNDPQSPSQTNFGMSAEKYDKHMQSLSFDNYMSDLMQLSSAASSGDAVTVKEILAKGFSADSVVDDSGITMLMQAANDDIAKVLIAAGADVTKADAKGWTALHHLAAREGDGKMALRLIKAGADIHCRNNDGETPLRMTGLLFTENISPSWGISLISLLIGAGADIDATDKQGYTLLHQAAFNDNEALARVCVLKGSNPDIVTKAGRSPRQIAVELGSKSCLKVFGHK